MKKFLSLLVCSVLCCVALTGCLPRRAPDRPDYPLDLVFSSGAGAWSTELTLNADGSFSGFYHDSEMGVTGPGYPNGTVYVCSFSGRFSPPEPVDQYSFRMTLMELNYDKSDISTIENGILYIPSEPYGMTDGTEFRLYIPSTPVQGLDEDFLSWWAGRFASPVPKTLDSYGLWNTGSGCGFFTM